MRRLMLLRHAKTEKESPTGRDIDRRLDERGRTEALEIAVYMARQGLIPNLALVSPAIRTRETWSLLAPPLSPTPAIKEIATIYGADAGDLLGMVQTEASVRTASVLIIGHNPALHEFALGLVESGARAKALADNFPTSSLAIIDFAVEKWENIGFRIGKLERFVSPRTLRENTGSG